MPKFINPKARTSTITNAFVNAIIPIIVPNGPQVIEALKQLDMSLQSICCAYCGDAYSEWDHFRPLVVKKMPTGYITEISNLVPSCGKCNQSKGNKNWRTWMTGNAKQSPRTRGIPDLSERVYKLERFEKWGRPQKIDFKATIVGDLWQKHWSNHEKILSLLQESSETAAEIATIAAKLVNEQTETTELDKDIREEID